MYQTVDAFVEQWEKEAELTLRVLEELTDASLERKVWEQGWTAARLAWHLVESIHYMTVTGLTMEAPEQGETLSAASIVEAYRKMSGELVAAIQQQWTLEDLSRKLDFGGEMWTYGATLHFTVMHQAHHRGQLTVILRQSGLRAPYVYGPALEDGPGTQGT